MSELTAEQFAQRAFDRNLLDVHEVESLWAEFGTRSVPASDFSALVLRKGLLTNFQIEKLKRGERSGYYYGKHKVLYLVGTGTFARVFRAVHVDTGDIVAVKVLRRRFCDDPKQKDQFIREGKMGATLRHPNIVPIYEEIYDPPLPPYLVMEFVEGNNLRQFVRMRGKLEIAESLRLIGGITNGLSYAFEKGIHHRDMKMSNVLVSSRGDSKLVDFGLAALSSGSSDASLADCPNPRTIDYAALERATGVRKDHPQSDIFFTGVILYRMLSGQAALHETKDRIQRLSVTRFQDIVPIGKLMPDLPRDVLNIVNRAIDLNPSTRYSTPGEMYGEVRAAIRRLERGDESSTLADVADEKPSQTLMVVEDNVAMQNMLREQLKKQGFRVLIISDPVRAIGRFTAEEETPDVHCVIFSAHGLGGKAIEAFNRFAALEKTRRVPAVILLNPAQEPLKEKLPLDDRHAAVSMPIRMKEFRGAIDSVMAKPEKA